MTIRLLVAAAGFDADSIIDLDPQTEAGLIAQKQATYDLTGGAYQYRDVGSGSDMQLKAGQRMRTKLLAGQVLQLRDSLKAKDRLGFVDAAGSEVMSWQIGGAYGDVLRPFGVDTTVQVSLTGGTSRVLIGRGSLAQGGDLLPANVPLLNRVATFGHSHVDTTTYTASSDRRSCRRLWAPLR